MVKLVLAIVLHLLSFNIGNHKDKIGEIVQKAIASADDKDNYVEVSFTGIKEKDINIWFQFSPYYVLKQEVNILYKKEFAHYREWKEVDVVFLPTSNGDGLTWGAANAVNDGVIDNFGGKNALQLYDALVTSDSKYTLPAAKGLGDYYYENQEWELAYKYFEIGRNLGDAKCAYYATEALNNKNIEDIQKLKKASRNALVYGVAAYLVYKGGQYAGSKIQEAIEWSLTAEGKDYIAKFEADKAAKRKHATEMLNLLVPERTKYEYSNNGDYCKVTLGTGTEIYLERYDAVGWIVDSRNLIGNLAAICLPVWGIMEQILATKYTSPEAAAEDYINNERRDFEKML